MKRELEAGHGLAARTVRLADGRGLRVVEAGAGGPLVVFEAGGGACASEWIAVQRHVAERTSTVAYDRAGYGGSDAARTPRTLQNMAGDLQQVLDAVAPGEPVILVAHSWGGPIVRAFVRENGDRVVGLVFVDATVSDLMSTRDARLASGMASVQAAIATLRLPNPLTRMLSSTFGPDFDPADRDLMVRDFVARSSAVTFRREAKEIAPGLATLKQWEDEGLPAVPIASVVGATPARGQERLRSDLIAHEREQMRRHGGTLVTVEGAGHYVPQQRPMDVARAIVDLVDEVRRQGRSS